jgi:hypothetical protein
MYKHDSNGLSCGCTTTNRGMYTQWYKKSCRRTDLKKHAKQLTHSPLSHSHIHHALIAGSRVGALRPVTSCSAYSSPLAVA